MNKMLIGAIALSLVGGAAVAQPYDPYYQDQSYGYAYGNQADGYGYDGRDSQDGRYGRDGYSYGGQIQQSWDGAYSQYNRGDDGYRYYGARRDGWRAQNRLVCKWRHHQRVCYRRTR